METISKTLTDQELFDRVVRFQVKQGRKAVNDRGVCYYLSPDGLRCAVGCCFKDDPETNGKALRLGGFIQEIKLYESGAAFTAASSHSNPSSTRVYIQEFLDFEPTNKQMGLMKDLQKTHDNAYVDRFVVDFLRRAAEVGTSYNLNHDAIREAASQYGVEVGD